ncbi:DUF2726 domain-containing protein [Xenorhabdus sp. KJ12.1]|uniref:DUF2726 domain-containing protein n=1 Tax=Xenorhabdus sp. KJ12.1 TaxID=1851571 RepID=UPI000C042106|nr:DUF2726 domain-containing protein [Xenorhabdus sp. KJ12.1]PHM72331.1 hypothetical protein Xekj_00609 [Xenorhabdus sp. KJ12.1]
MESELSQSHYEGYVADKYLINRKQNEIYKRLENILSGDFRISPKIRITDLIRPDKEIIEFDPERAKHLNHKLNNARFDFVVTDLNSGKIRGVIMSRSTLTDIRAGDFIVELLNKIKIPLFQYDEDSKISDDKLSSLLYEKFEKSNFE